MFWTLDPQPPWICIRSIPSHEIPCRPFPGPTNWGRGYDRSSQDFDKEDASCTYYLVTSEVVNHNSYAMRGVLKICPLMDESSSQPQLLCHEEVLKIIMSIESSSQPCTTPMPAQDMSIESSSQPQLLCHEEVLKICPLSQVVNHNSYAMRRCSRYVHWVK